MRSIVGIFIFLSFICSSKTFAYTPKEGNVSAILGLTKFRTNFGGSSTGASAPFYTGLGLVAVGDVNDHGSLEIGTFYTDKMYIRETGGKYIAEVTQLVHITLGYRHWINSMFSTSMSFFSAYPIGDPEIVHSDFPQNSQIDTSARDSTEYGFDLAFQGELWSNDKLALVWDGRFSKSVTPKNNEYADHYGILVGLRYFIQEKQHVLR